MQPTPSAQAQPQHTAQPPRSRWWPNFRRHPHPTPQHILGWHNIYIWPSTAGWMLALTLCVLLLASINYQLNLGFLLTFLIAGSALASAWLGHRNLQQLRLSVGTMVPTFQGHAAALPLQLQTPGHQHFALALALRHSQAPLAWVHTDVVPTQSTTLTLGFTPAHRGWHALPMVVIQSHYPLGVFRLWSVWQPQAQALIYPAPEVNAPPWRALPESDSGTTTGAPASQGHGHDDTLRPYQRGDGLRSVHWKKTATALASGSDALVVRSSHTAPPHSVWLSAQATQLTNVDAQIARLTAWVLQAHAESTVWGLHLPSGLQIPPNQGDAHLQACLTALATDGLVSTSA